MQHVLAAVITSAEGLTSIQITDTRGSYPTLHVVERSVERAGGLDWLLRGGLCLSALPRASVGGTALLLNFLETGRLVKR